MAGVTSHSSIVIEMPPPIQYIDGGGAWLVPACAITGKNSSRAYSLEILPKLPARVLCGTPTVSSIFFGYLFRPLCPCLLPQTGFGLKNPWYALGLRQCTEQKF
jgi:hypothetical protein